MAKQKKTVQQLVEEKIAKQRLAELVAAGIAAARPPQAVSAADAANQQLQKELFQRQVQAEYQKLVGPAGLGGANGPKSVTQLAQEQIGVERQKAAVALEVARLRGPSAGPLTGQELAVDRAMKQVAAEQQRALDRREYERATGTGAFAPPPSLLSRAGGVLGAAADASGFGGLFAKAGPNATTAERFSLAIGRGYALSAAGRAAGNIAEAQYQPFLTSQSLRDRATLDATPVLGSIFRGIEAGTDAISGRTGRIRSLNEEAAVGGIRGNFEGAIRSASSSQSLLIGDARARDDADRKFSLDRLESTKRETAIERKLYEENVRLLPYRQRLTEATRASSFAEGQLARVSNEYSQQQKRNSDLAAGLDEAARIRSSGALNSSRVGRFFGSREFEASIAAKGEAQMSAELAQGRQLAKQLADEEQRAKERVATARSGVRVAGRDMAEADAYEAQTREADARGEAQRLGDAGPLGRLQGLNAFRAVKQVGIDNVTPEERAAARAYFPQEVARLAEQSGERFRGQFRSEVPGGADYRDTVAGATQRADAARTLADNLAEADVKAASREMAKVVGQVLVEVANNLRAELLDEVRKLQQNAANRAMGDR